ncbi:DUF4249 domain-containing protein [Robiginitalea sp. M366]|uniref:DUF4249 family protein n=1 Tax=Robiginitalea aestuariiviva TaxID=3036903 RepID=UPI00240D5706|nr:DUF4249 family protein [Robiginitalea aestuariiviva]MDG1572538.1 DUF4249 domain-containing protein [Robiginitalea aestuariiviva]
MLSRRFLLLFLLWLPLASGCEDVIEVDTPEAEPRLIVDGLIRVDPAEAYVPVRITLRESAGFFEPVPVTQAENILIQVERFDGDQLIESFTSSLAEETPGSGVYIPDPNATFDQRIPTVFLNAEVRFTLQLRHRGRQYLAQTWYQPVAPIDFLVQGRATLLEGDETEVIVAFTDPGTTVDHYLFQFDPGLFLVTEDTFYQGQFFQFSYFYEEPIEPGTVKTVELMGADAAFYAYMDELIVQSDQQGPFQTPAATVRGNLVDVTDIDNRDLFDNTGRPDTFPLGYFAIVEVDRAQITIQ